MADLVEGESDEETRRDGEGEGGGPEVSCIFNCCRSRVMQKIRNQIHPGDKQRRGS
jgi:hypothetical protein